MASLSDEQRDTLVGGMVPGAQDATKLLHALTEALWDGLQELAQEMDERLPRADEAS